jgi:hypothetical protein
LKENGPEEGEKQAEKYALEHGIRHLRGITEVGRPSKYQFEFGLL